MEGSRKSKRMRLKRNENSNEIDSENSNDYATQYETLKLHNERLLNQNANLIERLNSFVNSTVLENERKNVEKYHLEKYSHLLTTEEELQRYQNNDIKLLNGIVTTQTKTIERLQEQLNRLHQDFEALESHRNNLSTENADLKVKIPLYLENVKSLSSENKDLQSEVSELREKQQELEKSLDNMIMVIRNTSLSSVNQKKNLDDLNQTNVAVMEVKTKFTDLLQNEFKCVICHEILVEAVITNCSHTFCSYCLRKWKAIKPNCPICVSVLTQETSNLVVDAYLNNIMPLVMPTVRANWLRIVKERTKMVNSEVPVKKSSNNNNGSASSQNLSTEINFQFPYDLLLQVHRRLLHFSDNEPIVVDYSSDVVDLTNEEAD